MTALAAIAQSGLQAAQLRLERSAAHVARLGAPDAPGRVQLQAAPAAGGVQARVVPLPPGAAGATLEAEVVEQHAATYAFQANLLVLRTADGMAGRLLDERT